MNRSARPDSQQDARSSVVASTPRTSVNKNQAVFKTTTDAIETLTRSSADTLAAKKVKLPGNIHLKGPKMMKIGPLPKK
jgi:hypothetical protein